MKKISIILILATLIGTNSFCQQNEINSASTKTAKNTLYGFGGTSLIVSSAGMAYERLIIERQDKVFNSILLKGRASYFGGLVSQHSYYDVSFVALRSNDKYHFEANLGVGMAFQWKNVLPSFSLGFRRQKPEGGLVFRTGVGYPEFLYLSFGAAF